MNVGDGVYHCHHCGEHGSIKSGNPSGYGAPLKTYERPKPIEAAPASLHEKMLEWFASRGIGQETVARNRVEEQPPLLRTLRYRGAGNRVSLTTETASTSIPRFDALRSISLRKKMLERILYGLDDLTDAEHLIITRAS